MSIEAALSTISNNDPRLREACRGARLIMQFAFDMTVASYLLSVLGTAERDGQRKTIDVQIGHFDPSRSVGLQSAWQFWPELELKRDEQTAVRALAEEEDYAAQLREAIRVGGQRIVNLRHPQTIAMRSLARRWADNLDQQAILQRADIDTGKTSGDRSKLPNVRRVDVATISYLALKRANNTDDVPPRLTSFKDKFDRSLILRLQGVACKKLAVPGDLTYPSRQDVSIPLVGFDTPNPRDPDTWQPTLNYDVVSDQHEPLLTTAFTTLIAQQGVEGFSAQVCGVLTEREGR